MKDYFKVEEIVEYYSISQYDLRSALKKDVIREIYKSKMEESKKKVATSDHLKRVWNEMNQSL